MINVENVIDRLRHVKPQTFIPEVVSIDKVTNPPLSEVDAAGLIEKYSIPSAELHRLGLFIFGIDVENRQIHGRQDGVIAGVDAFVSSDGGKVRAVERGEKNIDLDAGRLAAFISLPEDTPYTWKTDEILFHGKSTGLRIAEFPKDGLTGRFYLRTDRAGQHSRLVINPRPACESMCSWCARAYPDRERILGEKLEKKLQNPSELISDIESNPKIIAMGGFAAMTEINFISGDFLPREIMTQQEYLIEFINLARKKGFVGTYYYAGHQAFTQGGVKQIHSALGPGRMCYTLEHISRRLELMPIKGRVAAEEVSRILTQTAKIMGPENTEYYLIAGIDTTELVNAWINAHAGIAIPQVHVFTPYSPSHYNLIPGNRLQQLKNMLEVRGNILKNFGVGIPAGSNRSLFHLGGGV